MRCHPCLCTCITHRVLESSCTRMRPQAPWRRCCWCAAAIAFEQQSVTDVCLFLYALQQYAAGRGSTSR